jgi:biotin-(acetyl-CoA carboxylase) ligase
MLESWSRHMLVWIHEWLDSGMPRLARDYTGRMAGKGAEVTLDLPGGRFAGTVAGIDERGALLLQDGSRTCLVPLTAMLEPL